MMENRTPFFHLDRYSSLPRPGPIPVPPHSGVNALSDAPLRDCDGNNSGAQGPSCADGRSEQKGPERLQGWLADTLPGQAYGLDRGPFWNSSRGE
jgi:hypothetical protein